MKTIRKLALLGALLPIGLAGCSGEIVTSPPPTAVVETIPNPPSPNYVWMKYSRFSGQPNK